jgi:hypothetical protein
MAHDFAFPSLPAPPIRLRRQQTSYEGKAPADLFCESICARVRSFMLQQSSSQMIQAWRETIQQDQFGEEIAAVVWPNGSRLCEMAQTVMTKT